MMRLLWRVKNLISSQPNSLFHIDDSSIFHQQNTSQKQNYVSSLRLKYEANFWKDSLLCVNAMLFEKLGSI